MSSWWLSTTLAKVLTGSHAARGEGEFKFARRTDHDIGGDGPPFGGTGPVRHRTAGERVRTDHGQCPTPRVIVLSYGRRGDVHQDRGCLSRIFHYSRRS